LLQSNEIMGVIHKGIAPKGYPYQGSGGSVSSSQLGSVV
jgi:hypothetical protein